MKDTTNQFIDVPATDKELKQLKQSVPSQYSLDMKRWKQDQPKHFYLGFIAGLNSAIRIDMGKMTVADKRDYMRKLAIDAGLIAAGFGMIITNKILSPFSETSDTQIKDKK